MPDMLFHEPFYGLVKGIDGLKIIRIHRVDYTVLYMVLQYDLGSAVQRGADRGQLHEYIGAVLVVLDHLLDLLEVTNSPRKSVYDCLRALVVVLVFVRMRICMLFTVFVGVCMGMHVLIHSLLPRKQQELIILKFYIKYGKMQAPEGDIVHNNGNTFLEVFALII